MKSAKRSRLKKAINYEWELREKEYFEMCKKDISAQVLAVCMVTLKTRFGFGKKRMNDFYNDFCGTFNMAEKGLIFGKNLTTIDCINMIKDEYGIDLDNGRRV